MKSETKTLIAVAALALSLGCLTAVDVWAQIAPSSPSPLLGDWRATDGSATARIAPCGGAVGLCATVTEDRPAAGEASLTGQVVVRNLTPARNGWTGRYVADGQNLQARVRQIDPRTIELRVCVNALLCDTARYERVAR